MTLDWFSAQVISGIVNTLVPAVLLAAGVCLLLSTLPDSQYIRELKSYGLNPPARQLVEMKIHGVRPNSSKIPRAWAIISPYAS